MASPGITTWTEANRRNNSLPQRGHLVEPRGRLDLKPHFSVEQTSYPGTKFTAALNSLKTSNTASQVCGRADGSLLRHFMTRSTRASGTRDESGGRQSRRFFGGSFRMA